MKKIFKILWIIGMICSLSLVIQGLIQAKEAGDLYEKTAITAEDLKVGSEYKTITMVGSLESVSEKDSPESDDFYYKIRKLSGAELVGRITLDTDESVTIKCTAGDVKVLIMDEAGCQCFFAPATEVHLEPEEAGSYDIYLVGKYYTGKMTLEY